MMTKNNPDFLYPGVGWVMVCGLSSGRAGLLSSSFGDIRGREWKPEIKKKKEGVEWGLKVGRKNSRNAIHVGDPWGSPR